MKTNKPAPIIRSVVYSFRGHSERAPNTDPRIKLLRELFYTKPEAIIKVGENRGNQTSYLTSEK